MEHPEPEGEDPSGSVSQINQMTICVRRKPVTEALHERIQSLTLLPG